MKRAPLVLTGTVAGVAGILAYHTTAPSTAATGSPTTTTATTAAATAATAATTSSPATTASTAKTTSKAKTHTAAATRTVTGEDVSYQYGDLQLKVTETGGKITAISVAKLDVTDPHSQQIDEFAIPQLTQQATSAQSAKINGVSGASYTSAAYEQSLQSALDKLA